MALRAHPNPLWPHYRRFRVAERLLLTGHSHQAWPDVALRGLVRAFADAAAHVDAKWERAFAVAERVRRGYAAWLADREGSYALGTSVHELLVRFLSALPLRERPRLVTTDGEFHSLRRQLERLGEEGIEIVRVAARPAADVGERMAAAVDEQTAAALVSAVFFETAEIAGALPALAARCEAVGAELLVDVYHALGVLPYPLAAHGLERAFVTGGGYKYLQLGEGNAFLRVPPGCRRRPVVTGWFAEFAGLAEQAGRPQPRPGAARAAAAVQYPEEGAARFAGATYEPASHYRAAAVLDFFDRAGLRPELLRQSYLHQLAVLAEGIAALDADPRLLAPASAVPLPARGGFLAYRTPVAAAICRGLRVRGVHADHRGAVLRLGPAPYLSDQQLLQAVAALGEVLREQGEAGGG